MLRTFTGINVVQEGSLRAELSAANAAADSQSIGAPNKGMLGPRPPSSAPSPRRVASSKVRMYILGGKAAAGNSQQAVSSQSSMAFAAAAPSSGVSRVRVINETRLRYGPFNRLLAQRDGDHLDVATDAGMRTCFNDLFTLIDATGAGAVVLEHIVAFGRKVGGSTMKLLQRSTFEPYLAAYRDYQQNNHATTTNMTMTTTAVAAAQCSAGGGGTAARNVAEGPSAHGTNPGRGLLPGATTPSGSGGSNCDIDVVTRRVFMAAVMRDATTVLAPAGGVGESGGFGVHDAASRTAGGRLLAISRSPHAAGSGGVPSSATSMRRSCRYHPDDYRVMCRIFELSGGGPVSERGFVTLPGLQGLQQMDSLENVAGGRYSTERLFQRHDLDGDGKLSLAEFACMLAPAFAQARLQAARDAQPMRLYFKNVPGYW